MTIKIPEPMIAAALKTLQESGAANSPLSCDALLVERMIVAALMGGSSNQIGQLVADIIVEPFRRHIADTNAAIARRTTQDSNTSH